PESLATVEAESENTTGRTMMLIAIAWFVIAATLAFAGFFTNARFLSPFIVAPLIVFVAVFAVSPQVRAWAFALDPRWFVLFNTIRFSGIAFLVLYAHGRLDRNSALTAPR